MNFLLIVVYKVHEGTLTGQWTALGAEGHVYPETLTKVGMAASMESAPTHRAPR